MAAQPHPLRVTIAEEVRAQMGRDRISAVQLGRMIGRSQSYMSRRLVGDLPFDLDDLEAIAGALDVPLSRLLGATGHMPPDSRPVAAQDQRRLVSMGV